MYVSIIRINKYGQPWVTHLNRVLAIVFFSAVILSPRICYAQLSVPNILETPFDRNNSSTGDRRRQDDSNAGMNCSYLKIGSMNELSIRTNETSKGVITDIHAIGRNYVIGIRVNDKNRIILAGSSYSTKYFLNDPHTLVDANGKLNNFAFRYDLAAKNNWNIRLWYNSQNFETNGTTNLYQNIFGIFEKTPPFSLRKNSQSSTISLQSPNYRGWNTELKYRYVDAPGWITLNSSEVITSLKLPLSDRGNLFTFTLNRSLSKNVELILYKEHGDYSGQDPVMREANQAIGSAINQRHQDSRGVAVLNHTKSYLWHLFCISQHHTWNTLGQVPHGYDLGLSVPFAGNITYKAAYDLVVNTFGIDYQHNTAANYSIDLGYRWISIKPRFGASYGLNVLFIPTIDNSEIGGEWLYSHEIKIGFTVQLHNLSYRLECNQLIPVANKSGSSNGGSLASGGSSSTKSSDGGRYVGLSVTAYL